LQIRRSHRGILLCALRGASYQYEQTYIHSPVSIVISQAISAPSKLVAVESIGRNI
jgi:hypothetical protein